MYTGGGYLRRTMYIPSLHETFLNSGWFAISSADKGIPTYCMFRTWRFRLMYPAANLLVDLHHMHERFG